jgi:hypothetical protein
MDFTVCRLAGAAVKADAVAARSTVRVLKVRRSFIVIVIFGIR